MTAPREAMVAGEKLDDLVSALEDLKDGEPRANGMTHVSGSIGAAAVRAMMRIEAQLLLDDADAPAFDRTPKQRRADAFARLAEEMLRASR